MTLLKIFHLQKTNKKVKMKELIYKNGTAIVILGFEKLKSQIKPYLSFDYDELFFTKEEKVYIKSKTKVLLSEEQTQEIIGFIDNLSLQKDKIKLNEIINSLQTFLNNTDWMIIREIETGKKMPENIKLQRADARIRIEELRKSL